MVETKNSYAILKVLETGSVMLFRKKQKTVNIERDDLTAFLPDSFVVLDFETTGLQPTGNTSIIEIGAVKYTKESYLQNKEYETFQALILPRTGKISTKTERLTGITQQMIDSDAVKMDEIISDFLAFLGEEIIVGHNISFDRKFLERELYERDISIKNKYLCTLRESRRAFPNLNSHTLANLAIELDLANKPSHRALSDCLACMELFMLTSQMEDGTKMLRNITFKPVPNENTIGKMLACTGEVSKFSRREVEVLAKMAEMGFNANVTKRSDYVLVGKNPGAKLERAKKYGTKIIDQNEFIELLSAPSV